MTPDTRAKKVDGNQKTIVKALRQVGAIVLDLHRVGGSCPDLLVLFQGKLILLEVKNPEGFNRLSDGQMKFIEKWQGTTFIVRSIEDALRAIGLGLVTSV